MFARIRLNVRLDIHRLYCHLMQLDFKDGRETELPLNCVTQERTSLLIVLIPRCYCHRLTQTTLPN